jgi:hypothetical protein
MIAFACFDFPALLISLLMFLGFALGIAGVIAFVIKKAFKSGDSR